MACSGTVGSAWIIEAMTARPVWRIFRPRSVVSRSPSRSSWSAHSRFFPTNPIAAIVQFHWSWSVTVESTNGMAVRPSMVAACATRWSGQHAAHEVDVDRR